MAIERTLSSLVSITIVTTNDRRHIKRVKLLRFPSGRAGCVCGLSYAKKGKDFAVVTKSVEGTEGKAYYRVSLGGP